MIDVESERKRAQATRTVSIVTDGVGGISADGGLVSIFTET